MSDTRHAPYEFSAQQNQLIGELGKKMGLVGLVLAALGGLSMALSVLGLVATGGRGAGSIVPGLVMLLMGVWTKKASGGFKRIVKTEGSDMQHLMDALGEMKNLYGVLYGLALTGVILLALAFVAGVALALLAARA